MIRMNNIILHPGIILILSGIIAALVPEKIRKIIMILGPAGAITAMLALDYGTVLTVPFINGSELMLVNVDRLSYVFGMVFSMMSLIGSVYALHNKGSLETTASLCYAGSSLGVTLAGDWLTLIFFWELMAASSLFLVWANRSEKAVKAGFRYLLVHMFGGNCLLIGIIFKVNGGDMLISNVTAVHDAAFWLILLGVAINAAIPPFHSWLTDAYPEANVTGSVFLSSFTTKVAVYCLIRMFAGTSFLIWFGVAMALYGALFAIMENDVRRLLSYHIISQVGFMVAGVGIGTPLALDGATAHAFSHILYKSLLFMGAGAIITATGINKINQLGGLAKKMPFVCVAFTVGAFSISGVPLFNGFISKSITVSAACEAGYPLAELLLLVASVGTFLHVVMKMLYFIFFGEDKGIEVKPLPKNMYVAMSIGSVLCILYGVFPDLLYRFLPYDFEYHPFTWDHIMQYVQLLVTGVVPFIMYLEHMEPLSKISLDTDWFYRKPFAALVRVISSLCVTVQIGLGAFFKSIYDGVRRASKNPLVFIGEHGITEYEGIESSKIAASSAASAISGTSADVIVDNAEAVFDGDFAGNDIDGKLAAEIKEEAEERAFDNNQLDSADVYDPDKEREPIGDIMSVVIFTFIAAAAFIAAVFM